MLGSAEATSGTRWPAYKRRLLSLGVQLIEGPLCMLFRAQRLQKWVVGLGEDSALGGLGVPRRDDLGSFADHRLSVRRPFQRLPNGLPRSIGFRPMPVRRALGDEG